MEFTLDVKNEGPETMHVTSKHLISNSQHVVPAEQSGGGDGDMSPPILLAKLRKNQEIRLKAVAVKGVGKEHAKWSPVATATYKFVPEIKINQARMNELDIAKKKEWVNSCPTKVYGYNEKFDRVDVERPEDCTYCEECKIKADEIRGNSSDLVQIRHKQTVRGFEFVFRVETTGALLPEEVIVRAFNILRTKLNRVKDELSAEKNMYA